MDRDQKAQASNQSKQVFKNSQDVYNTSKSHADQLYGNLYPLATEQATNPTGYSPEDMASMNTASQQSIGGSVAGAVGEGNLAAARTRNKGAFAPVLAESVRSGMRQNSQNAVGIQADNAKLKEAKRQSAMSMLGDLFKTNTGAETSALGLGNQSTGTIPNTSGGLDNFLKLWSALNGGQA